MREQRPRVVDLETDLDGESQELFDFRAKVDAARELSAQGKFKEVLNRGLSKYLPWTEVERYREWLKAQRMDAWIKFRISSADLMKLKAFARMKGHRYQTFVRDILKREIGVQEERLAASGDLQEMAEDGPHGPEDP